MAARMFTSLRELPELEGWLTFGEAAVELEVTGERIRQMAQEGKLATAHRIGRRPVGVVREEEINAIIAHRKETGDTAALPPAQALRAAL